jgi:hypothetical protein
MAAQLENIFEKPFDEIAKLPISELDSKISPLPLAWSSKYCYYKILSKRMTDLGTPRSDLIEKMKSDQSEGVFKIEEEPELDVTLRDKWDNIENVYDKTLLMFFLKYPVLRSDLCNIKIRNYNEQTDNYYKDYTIHFNHMVKNDRAFDLVIRPEHYQLIDTFLEFNDTDYFWTRNLTSNAFIKILRRVSKKHFEKEYSIGYYRKLYVSTELDAAPTPRDFVERQREIAHEMNNSIQVQTDYYLQNIPQPEQTPEPALDTIEFKINGKTVRVTGINIKVEIIS